MAQPKPYVNPYDLDPIDPYAQSHPRDGRQTPYGDLLNSYEEVDRPKRTPLGKIPRSPHMKNSLSTGNADFTTRRPTHTGLAPVVPARPVPRSLHRCESSPSLMAQAFPPVQPLAFHPRGLRAASPDHYDLFNKHYTDPVSPLTFARQQFIRSDPVRNDPILREAIRGDSKLREAIKSDSVQSRSSHASSLRNRSTRVSHENSNMVIESPSRSRSRRGDSEHSTSSWTSRYEPSPTYSHLLDKDPGSYPQNSESGNYPYEEPANVSPRLSSRHQGRNSGSGSGSPRSSNHLQGYDGINSGTYNQPNRSRSPTKTLNEVPELHERYDSVAFKGSFHEYIPPSPKKRSRSPMKKMFGEGGWLGPAPDENLGKSSRSGKVTRPGEPKKATMIEKLKNKLEEFVSTSCSFLVILSWNIS